MSAPVTRSDGVVVYGQPAPKPGTAPHTVDLVQADLTARKAMGVAKYGVPHQADNGRDHLQDAYEEALDLCVYLRGEIQRRLTDGLKVTP